MFTKERVYLDYAAATPLIPEAVQAMRRVITSGVYGNPSAVHTEGQQARQVVENAREQIARAIQVRPEFVTFTSGGTEANNLALIGIIESLHTAGRPYSKMRIVTTRIEHPSVTETVIQLSKRGVEIDYVAVDEAGRIQIDNLRHILTPETVLVSFAYINSEIGTIQPLHHIRKTITDAEVAFGTKIFSHVDAAQAPLWVHCQFDAVGADAITFDFAKCGGPKGSGVLVLSRRVHIKSTLFGGGQESGLRPGTENVLGIVGGAVAFVVAQKKYKQVAEKVAQVRDAGIGLITPIGNGIQLNGALGSLRVANNINVSIPGIDTEYLTVWLDQHGFAVSTKSACAGAGGGESAVVREITRDPVRAQSTLRLTLGPATSVKNLENLVREINRFLIIQRKLTEK